MRRRNRAAAAYSESMPEERLADRGRSDGELLACFLASDDEVAFAALVARYARMVVAVCGDILRHRQDAEDAYQATILVLLRKAASLNQEEPIGGWLHDVAYHEAMNVKKSKKRREYHEGQCESCSTTQTMQPIAKVAFHELQDFVDEAVQCLPVKLRAVFRLCCLEKETNAEVSRQLGLPIGTVATRMKKALVLVGQDLRSRGVNP